jgi:uncharacterized protein (DUF2147 family)
LRQIKRRAMAGAMRTILLAALFLSAPAVAADPIAGRWQTENGKAIVTIGSCGGGTTCGRISTVLQPDPTGATTDRNNPDPKLRGRPIRGLEILSGFRDNGDDWRGRIYDPESGKTYKSIVKREGQALKVQGCIAFFCRTQRWTPAR